MSGDLVPATPEARREAIRHGWEEMLPLIAAVHEHRDWLAFAWSSWEEYVSNVIGTPPKLPRAERVEAVAELRSHGLSTRAIGSALGVSYKTVQRDIEVTGTNVPVDRVVGRDGVSRPAKRRQPEVVEPEVVEPEVVEPEVVEECSIIPIRIGSGARGRQVVADEGVARAYNALVSAIRRLDELGRSDLVDQAKAILDQLEPEIRDVEKGDLA